MEKEKDKKNKLTLIFIVNGSSVEIEVNLHQPLKVGVEKALKESGNEGRPLEDWLVRYNDQILGIGKSVESFDFPEKAKLFVSLKSGEGGDQ